jgi:hypothetical protein
MKDLIQILSECRWSVDNVEIGYCALRGTTYCQCSGCPDFEKRKEKK